LFARFIPTPTVSQFSVGPITIHAYALCIILGAITAIWLTNKRYIAAGGSEFVIGDLAIWVIPGGIIGARIYHVITSPEYFFGKNGNPENIFKIWEGGLGIWGAITGGFLVALWKYKRELPFSEFADSIAPGLLIAQGIGRFGNWFNGELYGSESTLPWALKLNNGNTYHPTFLYEAICNFTLAFILIKFTGKFKSGSLFLLYVSGYCSYRFFIEGIRIDDAHILMGLRLNQWVSLLLGGATLMKFLQLNRRSR
jgi:prolipoprotein diacylglyceryl transferase